MNKKTIATLDKYGWEICEQARYLNEVEGEGGTYIAMALGLTWQQGYSALIAGRALKKHLEKRKGAVGNVVTVQ